MAEFTIEEIPCSFKKISNSPEPGLRSGRYSGSYHWDIKEFALKKWVVLGYLDIDWVDLENKGKSQDEIIVGCLKFLNKLPEKQKGSKKEPKRKFGLLEPYKHKFITKDGKNLIIVEFKTNERANPNFWCEGQSWNGTKVGKKRGRPPKVKVEAENE